MEEDRNAAPEKARIKENLSGPASSALLSYPRLDVIRRPLQIVASEVRGASPYFQCSVGSPDCLLVVSHDRYFIDRLVDHLFVFDGKGGIHDVQGNFTDYRSSGKHKQLLVHTNITKAESRKTKLVHKKLSYIEKREFEGLEGEIAELEDKKSELNAKLSQPNEDYGQLAEWGKELEEVKSQIATKEDRWLELSEIG